MFLLLYASFPNKLVSSVLSIMSSSFGRKKKIYKSNFGLWLIEFDDYWISTICAWISKTSESSDLTLESEIWVWTFTG